MILRSIRACDYGTLKDRSFRGLGRFVVFHGPNEAGKSTLRRLIQDLLYGFRPATRESHPYAPWDGREMGGEAEIEWGSGEVGTVRRKLLLHPSGSWTTDGDKTKLDNRPVDGLGAIGRDLYEALCSLAREDLEFPEDAWGEVRDRLIGSAGVRELRPAREAADELEKEGKTLWRADGRGKDVKARDLREAHARLGAELRKAEERETDRRAAEEDLSRLDEEQTSLARERSEIRVRLRRAVRLVPLARQLDSMRRYEETARGVETFADIGEDVEARLARWAERIDSLDRDIAKEKAGAEEAEAAGKEPDPRCLRATLHREEIREAIDLRVDLEREERELAELEGARARAEGTLRERARGLLVDPTAVLSGIEVPEAEAAVRIRAYRSAREKRLEAEAASRAASASPFLPSGRFTAILASLGAVLVVGSFFAGAGAVRFPLSAAGAAALITAALVLVWRRIAARAGGAAAGRGGTQGDLPSDARRREAVARAEVVECLRALEVLPSRLEDPDEFLARDLAELARGIEEHRSILRRVEDVDRRVDERKEKIAELAGEIGIEAIGDAERVRRMERLLEEAREAERARSAALEAGRRAARAIESLEMDRGAAIAKKTALEDRLLPLGGEDTAARLRALREKREAARRAIEARLEIEEKGERIEDLEREIRDASEGESLEPLSDAEIVRLQEADKAIEEKLRTNAEDRANKRRDIEDHGEGAGPAEIEGERRAIREEIREAEVRRDRLALLAGIVREADSRFRAEHEPDVLARAADGLSRVTGGRYGRIDLGPAEDAPLLRPREAEGAVPAGHPISRGTLDQVYLCLRLALVEHLEADGEALPLLLDDVLLHWDEERRERGFEVLGRIAERRQVMLFTCRREVAEGAERAGARIFELEGPQSREEGAASETERAGGREEG